VKHRLQTKRVYDAPAPDNGARVLVDRIWPRGVTKERARVDAWEKDVAPSTSLRKWFGHDPRRWDEFQRRYEEELEGHPEPLARLRALCEKGPVTLVFSARDTERNQAVALQRFLEDSKR